FEQDADSPTQVGITGAGALDVCVAVFGVRSLQRAEEDRLFTADLISHVRHLQFSNSQCGINRGITSQSARIFAKRGREHLAETARSASAKEIPVPFGSPLTGIHPRRCLPFATRRAARRGRKPNGGLPLNARCRAPLPTAGVSGQRS